MRCMSFYYLIRILQGEIVGIEVSTVNNIDSSVSVETKVLVEERNIVSM